MGKPVAWIAKRRFEQMTSAEPWLTNIVYSEDQSVSFPCVPLCEASEVDALREAIKPAYLGLLVLKTMCRKAGLEGGVDATESAMKALVDVMPELPALSALRVVSPLPTDNGRAE